MEIKVLGPLTINANGRSIVPSAGKPRQLLALLTLRMGQVVFTPTMLEELWGDETPRSAATTLQTYILHLRREIAKALPDRPRTESLSTHFGGYRLDLRGGRLDLAEFDERAARGAAALERGDAAGAAEILASALGIWSGPALGNVPVGRVLELELLGMEEARMRTLERRIEADLMLGRHRHLLPELRMLAAGHPMNENFCAQLMLALYRSGHVWRALEAFRTLRETLVEELGIEPSLRLQRLHQAMLTGNPDVEPLRIGA
ncbi:AfsR/SARP family transcriptional regulator [Thermomonospora umbrina]|uniref:DNA-binding SARP family transcriptional activator n=1 Tax=Thermomonospora umbrina TaxID=111806 RepID=A0A3D9STG5_9ACTN|nr:AfsR/SARP family transcriptional regulator [Thermomonospora umbrina]REE96265.1 DNA-binding SARP family transcriptional activator [Thermomonospora umbrina]